MAGGGGGKANKITGDDIDELADDTAEHPAAPERGDDDRPESLAERLDVSGTQVCASTLASVSAAAVASVFGVTGTVVGAAIMSVIATTGSALYTHGIRQTGAKLQQTPVADLTRRVGGAWPRATDDPTEPASPDAEAQPTSGPAAPTPGRDWRAWLAERRWGVAIGVGLVFVATMGVVTLIELAGQRSLADITGNSSKGTSIGSIFEGSGGDDPAPGDSTTTVPGEDPAATDAPADGEGDGSTDDTTVEPTDPAPDDEEPPATAEPTTPPDAGGGDTDTGAAAATG
jgi:hypothetical protein